MTHEPANTTGKGSSDKDTAEEPVPYTVLSHRAIAVWAVLIVAAGIGMAVWLLLAYGHGDDPRVQLDAIRTAGTVVVGAGGAAALLLAARRQRTAEIALKQKDRDQADVGRAHALQERVAAETRAHQERVAQDTREDAAARRITELYTAAAAQLGSDKAPVRLAGLYALERLAQDNPGQRQTIVNVLCASLRMPYAPPSDPPDLPDGHVDQDRAAATHTERVQEREVRVTAQRILFAHLQPGADATLDTFWAGTDLDLTGAILINFELRDCHLRSAQFTQAKFVGDATFVGTEFAGDARFDKAEFAGDAAFDTAKFAGYAQFDAAKFAGVAKFVGVGFAGYVQFVGVEFAGHAWFDKAEFAGDAAFDAAKFAGFAHFVGVEFAGDAGFDMATFASYALFNAAEFAGHASFGDSEESSETSFSKRTSFEAAVFAQGVPAAVERFWSPPAEGEAADLAAVPDGRSG